MTTWLPVAVYDRIAHQALKHGTSVSGLVRATLTKAVTPPAAKRPEPR